MRKRGPTKLRGKEKGKLTGPSFISAQTIMDHDQFLIQGPKRKGDVLFEDSTEVWEKEKRLKRNEDDGTCLIFSGSVEVTKQPRRVQ